MEQCLFCRIITGEIPAEIVYRDENAIVFKDINPQAPVHLLVIPVRHIARLTDPEAADGKMLSQILKIIQKMAVDHELEEGFRVVANCGENGGQTVHHLHFHILGRRCMSWPPG